jgi:hypothetical protein
MGINYFQNQELCRISTHSSRIYSSFRSVAALCLKAAKVYSHLKDMRNN